MNHNLLKAINLSNVIDRLIQKITMICENPEIKILDVTFKHMSQQRTMLINFILLRYFLSENAEIFEESTDNEIIKIKKDIDVKLSEFQTFINKRFGNYLQKDHTRVIKKPYSVPNISHGTYFIPCKHNTVIDRICCNDFMEIKRYYSSTCNYITYDTTLWKNLVNECLEQSKKLLTDYKERMKYILYFMIGLDCPIPVMNALFGSKILLHNPDNYNNFLEY